MSDPASEHGFLRQVLRWLAIICLASGIVAAANLLVYLSLPLMYFRSFRYRSTEARVRHTLDILTVTLPLVPLVGGWGLLKWKPWARRTLIVWALADMVLTLASSMFWFITLTLQSATTRYTAPSPALQGWSVLHSWLTHIAFPVLVLLILMHREVRELWAVQAHGAFEVLPLSRSADVDSH